CLVSRRSSAPGDRSLCLEPRGHLSEVLDDFHLTVLEASQHLPGERAGGAKPPAPVLTRLLPEKRPLGFLLEIQVLRLLDSHSDPENRPTLERPGGLVELADGVTAIIPDTEPIPGPRKLARLRLHRTCGRDGVVHVQLGSP